MFICKSKACPKAFDNLFTLKPKNKYQLKRSCTLIEPFCKSNFSQLCINYRGPHLWNTIVLSQNTDLEQSTTPKVFKEKRKAHLFTLTRRCLIKSSLFDCRNRHPIRAFSTALAIRS